MFGEEFGEWNDQVRPLETELATIEKVIGSLRARQAEILSELDVLQVDLGEGDRGMADWTARSLDVSTQIAHRLMVMAHHSDSRWLSLMREGEMVWTGPVCWSNWRTLLLPPKW
jgi:hypothetical protein